MGILRAAYRARVLTPTSAAAAIYLPDALVCVDEHGRIERAERWSARRAPPLVQDLRPRLMVPGFVDAHVHYPQTRIIGRASGPLLEWLETSVFPEEARFARRAYAERVADEMIDRMLGAGTTTAAIFSSSSPRATEVLLGRLAERGMRAMVGLTLMDRGAPKELLVERKTAMQQARRLVERWHGHDGRLELAITPRFALSCSRAMLEDAGRLARELDLPVQTHIGETRAELRATKKAHGYARDYLDVYDRAGLIGPRTILAHAIHLSAREWNRLARAGAAVAHCPDSNFFLGSGRMPLAQALSRGITVALGSDVAAGRSFSMRRAMASAYDSAMCLEAPVEPARLFAMATLGGAHALGLGDRIGSLEVGKDADFAVIELSPAARTLDEVLAELTFDTDEVRVAARYVRGRRLSLQPPARGAS